MLTNGLGRAPTDEEIKEILATVESALRRSSDLHIAVQRPAVQAESSHPFFECHVAGPISFVRIDFETAQRLIMPESLTNFVMDYMQTHRWDDFTDEQHRKEITSMAIERFILTAPA